MKINKLYIVASAAALLGLSACGDYLDTLPDDRATVDTEKKAAQLLTTAYPTHLPAYIFEYAGDNVTDNGPQYTAQPNQDKVYRFEDDTYTGNDDPYSIWNSNYSAVATANEAMKSLDEMGGEKAYPEVYAEARLCRAFGMFQQANIFCMAYNPDSADVYLGLPYPLEPEQDVDAQYERGTLKQLYENINADIEAALPNVGDNHLTVPKYHFNVRAAYAFAAQFNLYYHNYDKAIEYATKALGGNPAGMVRDFSALDALGAQDIHNAYIQSNVNANYLLVPAYSLQGRAVYGFRRYAQNMSMVEYETVWAKAPWGSGTRNNTLIVSHMQYGSEYALYFPKMLEDFEITDKINDTGYPHIVVAMFTTEKTLLVRAEAYALKGEYDKALDDMNLWMSANCYSAYGNQERPTLTVDYVNQFMEGIHYATVELSSPRQRSFRKTLHPQGFTVEKGTQENIIQLILQMRRIETLHEGFRLLDIKRYGIEYQHLLDGESPITIKAADKRLVFQLPVEAIQNGLTANPR